MKTYAFTTTGGAPVDPTAAVVNGVATVDINLTVTEDGHSQTFMWARAGQAVSASRLADAQRVALGATGWLTGTLTTTLDTVQASAAATRYLPAGAAAGTVRGAKNLGAATVLIVPQGSDTIDDGAVPYELTPGKVIRFQSDGSGSWVEYLSSVSVAAAVPDGSVTLAKLATDAKNAYAPISADWTGGIAGSTRSLAGRQAERLSVKDFGAVGDGVTDDSAAFIAAATAARNGATTLPYSISSDNAGSICIDVPPGKYLITQPNALLGAESTTSKRYGLMVRGAGSRLTNIIFKPSSGSTLVTNDYWLGLQFQDISFWAATTDCTFMLSSTTHAAQRYYFKNVSFNGFKYCFNLQGNNNNSEFGFYYVHNNHNQDDGAFFYVGASNSSDQFLNYWFVGCTHWSTSAPFIDAAAGGSFHIFGFDASDWGASITNTAGVQASPGKLFYLRGTSHAQGVCNFEAYGVRAEIKNADGGLLYSEWPQGNVTFKNADVSSQTGVYTYNEMVFIRYQNADGAHYVIDSSTMAGYIRVGWAVSDWSHSHRIVVQDTRWLQRQRPDLAVVYDTSNTGGNNINWPFVEFIRCRPAPTWTNLRVNGATWDAVVATGRGGELLYPVRKRELRLSDIYGGPPEGQVLYPTLPLYAVITELEVMIPAGTTADTTTGTWTLQTKEASPVTIASVGSGGPLNLGCRAAATLSPPYRLSAVMDLQLVTSGVAANNPATIILVKGYW